MKTTLIAGLLVAGSCLFAAPVFGATRLSVGIGVGAPAAGFGYAAPAPVYGAPAFVRPPAPHAGFVWTEGYWFGEGRHRVWRPGYWAAPRRDFDRRDDFRDRDRDRDRDRFRR
jgi:hypothetical protein